ncbi:MAG: metallophosphoesterase, partial [Clostridia bacterium]|nr:metallophosphoesterase [Clostridia bacterium]
MKKTIRFLTSAILCLLVAVGSFATLPKTVSAVDDGIWVDSLAEPANYAYSLAVVGDTQYVTMYQPKALKNMYKWIADNAATKKMQYVIGVGDITHTDGAVEWANAYDAISQLDGKVGYALVRGNHDIRTSYYDYHFGRNEALYSKQYFDAFNSGKVTQARNTAHEFEVAGKKYLIICLDFGAKDDVLAWANEVVASHPSHTVIVTT